MKVKFFNEEHIEELEEAVNNWLSENTDVDIIDIKYCRISGYQGNKYYSFGSHSIMIEYYR